LDIDDEVIEQALMQQLDTEVMPKIAEFFFEQHYDQQEMRYLFGGSLKTRLSEVMHTFHKFRSLGYRLHYWP